MKKNIDHLEIEEIMEWLSENFPDLTNLPPHELFQAALSYWRAKKDARKFRVQIVRYVLQIVTGPIMIIIGYFLGKG